MEGSQEDKERIGKHRAILFLVILLAINVAGRGILVLGGLSSVQGEKFWKGPPDLLTYNIDNLREGEVDIDYNWLHRIGRDIVVGKDVRWILSCRITLFGNDEYIERHFSFYFLNISNGHVSDRVLVKYGADNDFGNKSVVFDRHIKFYRPGEYVLRVVDQLPGSEVNFTGHSSILVYGEELSAAEDLHDDTVGFLLLTTGFLVFLIAIYISLNSTWKDLGLSALWEEIKEEWHTFWGSWYGDILVVLWMLISFDVLTTFVSLPHGGWEGNETARKDMYGTVWFNIFLVLCTGFFMFFLRRFVRLVDRKDHWLNRLDIGLLSFLVLGALWGFLWAEAVVGNLGYVETIGGGEIYVATLFVIIVVAIGTTSILVLRHLRKENSST
jgi:hypothetical protein